MSIINFKVEDKGKVISVSYDASITIKDFILDYLAKHWKKWITRPKSIFILCWFKLLDEKNFIR